MSRKVFEVRIGFLFPLSGIGAGYLLLGIALALISSEIPDSVKFPVASFLILIWGLIQFSFATIQYDPEKKRLRVCSRLFYLLKTGKWIDENELEAYYTRPAIIKTSVQKGSAAIGLDFSKETTEKTWIIEIKHINDLSYKPIIQCNKTKLEKVKTQIFDRTGIKHERIQRAAFGRRR